MIRKRITVHGQVQGVGYRYLVRRVASKLGVRGYMCNQDDGTILIVAEGEEELLSDLLKAVNVRGSPV